MGVNYRTRHVTDFRQIKNELRISQQETQIIKPPPKGNDKKELESFYLQTQEHPKIWIQ